ncbi:MAG: efflux RND transporter periplasmic adaptor subunit [Calditerricola sp.]|nr:efflux RND transporter periplasmic adaptor subunit [Calditerricola sp.]
MNDHSTRRVRTWRKTGGTWRRAGWAALLLAVMALAGCSENPSDTFSGTIEGREVPVMAQVAGTVVALQKGEGDAVTPSDVLAKLDDALLTWQLKEAEAARDAAVAQWEAAKDRHAASHVLRQLRAQKDQAQARVEQIKVQLARTTVRSPISGIIVHRHVEVGEVVQPGALLFTVLDPTDLEVTVYVPEPELHRVRVGKPVTVRVDAYPNRTFAGKIVRISNRAAFTPDNVQTLDERAKTVVAVTVALTEGEKELKPGMPADVIIPADEPSTAS